MATNPLRLTITSMGAMRPMMPRPLLPALEQVTEGAPRPRKRTRPPAKMAANVTQRVKYILHRKEAFYFRRAITLKTTRKGGYWIHAYNPLCIAAYGRTKFEALSAFAMELSSAWHWIAEESDELLAPDALALKQKLHKLITVVPSREVLSEFAKNQ